ncbi:siderophore-interacting protein [Ornithinimicrobium sp. Y1694]|uniref:siderophore-interacting protein n=1 Tax=Ornithinimicrobium sp. Y1694 TaxID=3418590 RepID=UPI003CE9C78D
MNAPLPTLSAETPARLRRAVSATASRIVSSAVNSQAAAKATQLSYARSMAMPLERTEHRCVPGHVAATEQVAPWLRRLTLHVPSLSGYAVLGPDEFVGLVMPRPGIDLPDLSHVTGPNPRPVIAALPEEIRPDVRWYTVRSWDDTTHELVIDVVLHPEGEVDEGPGASWVRSVEAGAQVGTEVAVQTGTACYHPPTEARVQVIAGDETAYPAIAGILESVGGEDVEPHVFLEVGAAGVVPELPTPARGSVTLVERGDRRPGEALLEAISAAALPAPDYGWVCGEQELAASVRRHLVSERGLAKTAVYFCAYWILGRTRG